MHCVQGDDEPPAKAAAEAVATLRKRGRPPKQAQAAPSGKNDKSDKSDKSGKSGKSGKSSKKRKSSREKVLAALGLKKQKR